MDKDLEGFVVQDIGEENGDDYDMIQKYNEDALQDDRMAIGEVYRSVILG